MDYTKLWPALVCLFNAARDNFGPPGNFKCEGLCTSATLIEWHGGRLVRTLITKRVWVQDLSLCLVQIASVTFLFFARERPCPNPLPLSALAVCCIIS